MVQAVDVVLGGGPSGIPTRVWEGTVSMAEVRVQRKFVAIPVAGNLGCLCVGYSGSSSNSEWEAR